MTRRRSEPQIANEQKTRKLAVGALVLMAVLATVGPSGVLAWSKNRAMLEQRQQELTQVSAERDDLRNRVALLDPRHTDPDLTGELLRSNLNVVHPDEVVMLIK